MLTFGSHLDGQQDVSDQFIDYLRRRAERAFRKNDADCERVKTPADFEARRQRVHDSFLRAIGGLPAERTPLNARITGTIDAGEYRIEKLIYHSLPNFPVTASLYVPKSRIGAKPGPAILFVCGHTEEAKAAPVYQNVCIDLARDNFVVLAVDPIGQGERFQFIDEETGEQRVRWGTTEHTYAGVPFFSVGSSNARYFIWDDIRGIDYLLSRPEVDPGKIGVTGNSGGGLQTCYLMMAEPRIAAAMPCTFVMSYEMYLKCGQPQDGEQQLYAGFIDGPDHYDFIAAMAPRPVRVGLAAYDFFPIEGALESIERAKKLCAAHSDAAARNIDYVVGPHKHTYSDVLRHAAVNFFRRALRGDPENFSAPTPEVLPPAKLNATEKGQVLQSLHGCATISQLRRETADAILARKEPLKDPQTLRSQVAEVLGIGASTPAPEASWTGEPRRRTIYPRILENEIADGFRTEKIYFFAEPEICCAGVLIHPADEAKSTTTEVLLLDEGTDAIPAQRARIVQSLEQNRRVFVFDPRGIGAVKSRDITSSKAHHSTEYRLGCDAMKLKTSTLGLRVFDVLRGIDYLRARPDAGQITLAAAGAATAWGILASVLEPQIAAVTLENSFLSWRDCVNARYYNEKLFNLRTTAWGILRVADIADLFAAIAPRKLTFIRPVSAMGTPLAPAEIRDFLKATATSGNWAPEIS
jgi:hypothetical protein